MRDIPYLTMLIGGAVVAATLACRPAFATVVELTSRPGGADIVDWGQLGSSFISFGSPVTFTSAGGITGTADLNSNASARVGQQGGSWNGNFAPGDNLLRTHSSGQGSLTLSFGTGLSSVGAQIEADFLGRFTAQIQAFDGNTSLGTFTETGNANRKDDNSAIFLGVSSSLPDITSIVYSLPSCSLDCANFAINQLSLASPSLPEPGSLALLAGALIGFGAFRRRARRSPP
jgi:PEP-CTERM motif